MAVDAFEDVLQLAAPALAQEAEDVVGTLRSFLASIAPEDAAAHVLRGARHALLACRGAGRPSLSSYACKTSLSMAA